jgi:hypothetical protein
VNKNDFYKWIKIAGMLSYVPVILVSGPLAGYFAGDYLAKKFELPGYVPFIMIGFGFIASALEVIRVVRKVSRIEKTQ